MNFTKAPFRTTLYITTLLYIFKLPILIEKDEDVVKSILSVTPPITPPVESPPTPSLTTNGIEENVTCLRNIDRYGLRYSDVPPSDMELYHYRQSFDIRLTQRKMDGLVAMHFKSNVSYRYVAFNHKVYIIYCSSLNSFLDYPIQ